MAKKRRRRRATPPRFTSGPKKGQFKPRAKSSTPARKSASTKGTSMARRRRRRGGRARSRRGGSGGKSFQSEAQGLMLGGAIYGFITEGAGGATATVTNALAKVPTIGNRDITNGLAIYFLNKHLIKNKHVRSAAMAALVTGATTFGRNGFSLSGGSDLSGFDDAIDVSELSGELDLADDDFE